ncbi:MULTISPECIES: SPW repeat protein [unclassified Kitasatospora]|uniref:SPW repeat protein n=1 Tax=unclassified Kitasatospora TaxID=2633591 RepID=UPI0009E8A4FB
METHPDIVAMRDHYERVVSTPRAQAVEALAMLSGLFLAISAWVVGFSGSSGLTVNNLILGLAFTVLMAGYGSAYERTHARAWAATLIGAWTILAPWVVSGPDAVRRTILTNVITGGLMVCLGLAAVAMAADMAGRGLRRSGSGGMAAGG